MMSEEVKTAVAAYIASRRQALKRITRHMRKEAKLSQGDVAAFLGGSRTRITEIEREESGTDYSVGELELLAVLFGRHPMDLLRMSGQDAIEVGEVMTALAWPPGPALLQVTDCQVPKRLRNVLAIDEMPGDIEFSPTGDVMASIVDSFMTEGRMEGDPPYHVTILCWDTRSGELMGEIRLPYAEKIAPLASDRIVIVTDQPDHENQDAESSDGIFHLLVWHLRSGKIEQQFQLLDRVQELAVSPDGRFLAAYMPATTTIQVWQTLDWQPVSAFELDVSLNTSHPGGTLRTALEYRDLPRERKFAAMLGDYHSSRFEFLNNAVLVVGFEEGIVELDVSPASVGYATSPLGPLQGFPRVAHTRNEHQEIAVRAIEYDYQPGAGDSKVRLYYQVPKGNLYPPDAEVEVVKRFSGTVHQPTILDSACILAWVSYNTPYRWGRVYKRRAGLVNVVSGRVVMLEDQGRLRPGDNQMYAHIAPKGDMVAYWTFPYEQEPRLAIQLIDTSPLRDEEATLETELEKSRKRRAEEDAYMLSLEEEGNLRPDGKHMG